MFRITDDRALLRALSSPIDPLLKRLLTTRRAELGEDYPLEELANFVVVQPGDSAGDLERAIGFSVFRNPVDGSRYGDAGFSPGCEWIQDHGFAYELCFVMDDSGFGHVVIVPKAEGIDPELLRFCAEYASEHA